MEQITKYPLFGKSRLSVDEVFGGLKYDAGGCFVSPAFRGAPVTVEATVMSDVRVRAFGSGSEFMGWTCRNCDLCAKQKNDIAEPTDLRSGGCSLELRLAIAYMDDGKIPFKAVKRIGYDSLVIRNGGVYTHLTSCKEFVQK